VSRYKGALALASEQQVFGGKLINGLTHRTLTHLKTGGEFDFAGNGFAWLPFTCVKRHDQQSFDLLVKRTEGSRRIWT
jgi:hypothetical protein